MRCPRPAWPDWVLPNRVEALSEQLLIVVDETMPPASVNMWLRAPERRQL